MTNPVWPSSLPQRLLSEGFSITWVDQTIRSPMSVGDKSRPRDTKEIRVVQGLIMVDAAQYADLRVFYRDTLIQGSLDFDWVDPMAQETAQSFNLMGPPQLQARDGDLFVVQLNLKTV